MGVKHSNRPSLLHGSQRVKVVKLRQSCFHVRVGNAVSRLTHLLERVSLLLNRNLGFLRAVNLTLQIVKIDVGRRHFSPRLVDNLFEVFHDRFGGFQFAVGFGYLVGHVGGGKSLLEVLFGLGGGGDRVLLLLTHDRFSTTKIYER